MHTLNYLYEVKGQINELPEGDKVLKTTNVKAIKQEDSSSYIAEVISNKYKELVDEKNGTDL